MKKIKRFAYAGAVILLSTGFAACSSTDDALETTPVERGVVKTDFTIAIPGKMSTRMSDVITQAQEAPAFRGMDSIRLIPFATGKNGDVTKDIIQSGHTRLGNMILLGNGGVAENAGAIASLNPDNNSHLYKDVAVPIGTKSFLFYGVAKKADAVTGVPEKQIEGVLSPVGLDDKTATPAGINFSLVGIYTNEINAKATKIVEYLDTIVKAGNQYGAEGTSFGDNAWEKTTSPLHSVYTEFTRVVTGSSANIRALVEDLYVGLQTKSDPVSQNIRLAIKKSDYASVSGTTVTLAEALAGYPANIYLPDGAAFIKFNSSSKKFEVLTAAWDDDDHSNQMNLNIARLGDFTYPASLYYRVNSTIVTDNASKEQYYVGDNHKKDWSFDTTNGVLGQYSENPGEVKGSTRSLAIVDQVQYAVARLDTKVKSYTDKLQDKENTEFSPSLFSVTGILVGGQKKVDFLFKPITSETKVNTIWDNQLQNDVTLSMTSDSKVALHTLVLETPEKEPIQFAIELQNNSGKAFAGKDGIVPNGCKFYLVGRMIPPGIDGVVANTTGELTQVFKQDYYTVLTATIKSLSNAYNTVPDLRVPQLELGLSVNLEWQAANAYTVELQ